MYVSNICMYVRMLSKHRVLLHVCNICTYVRMLSKHVKQGWYGVCVHVHVCASTCLRSTTNKAGVESVLIHLYV
jgi:hypothetical protein